MAQKKDGNWFAVPLGNYTTEEMQSFWTWCKKENKISPNVFIIGADEDFESNMKNIKEKLNKFNQFNKEGYVMETSGNEMNQIEGKHNNNNNNNNDSLKLMDKTELMDKFKSMDNNNSVDAFGNTQHSTLSFGMDTGGFSMNPTLNQTYNNNNNNSSKSMDKFKATYKCESIDGIEQIEGKPKKQPKQHKQPKKHKKRYNKRHKKH